MNLEILLALILFAFVSTITPGPNNLMLMSSGANFGFKRTIPHMLGINFGFSFMVLLVGVGLLQLFDAYPISYNILKVVSVIYLLYLSFKIATSTSLSGEQKDEGSPFTFIQAAAFQWVNPKAWTMALTSTSVYSPSQNIQSITIVALVFGIVNFPSVSCWIFLGQRVSVLLSSVTRLRAFNFTMAGLLVLSLYPVVFS